MAQRSADPVTSFPLSATKRMSYSHTLSPPGTVISPLSPGANTVPAMMSLPHSSTDTGETNRLASVIALSLPEMVILRKVLKPRLIAGLTPDVVNYARANPGFPNQSTVDQFFDEAQFESYRQLGLHIGQQLFGRSGQSNEMAEALWRYLDDPQP